jgi:hypothetical protein
LKRDEFLWIAAGIPLAGLTPKTDVAIPVELRGGRFFAVPKLRDGRAFDCWLDTSGSGFIFDWAVHDFNLPTKPAGKGRSAQLPDFDPTYTIPPVVQDDGWLGVFDMSAGDKRDPILRGFHAQLGGTWFAGRVWEFDFPGAKLTLLSTGLTPETTTVGVGFDRNYPQVTATIAGAQMLASIDTAATVSYKDEFAGGGATVQATSFVPRGILETWHADFPNWSYDRNVATWGDVARIVVPEVRIGRVTLRDVAFTNRPNDDVFASSAIQCKLGSNAYDGRVLTIDYPRARLRIE